MTRSDIGNKSIKQLKNLFLIREVIIMLKPPPKCMECKNFIKEEGIFALACKAFPSGIPQEIWNEKIIHDKPYLNDNGYRYDPKDK
jgi:hypothetical protein